MWPDNGQQRGAAFFCPQALLITAAFFLPVAIPSLFGWMNGLLAVPIFFLFQTTADDRQAFLQIRNGLLLAAGGALLLNQLVLIVFALAMLPLGYSLYRSAQRREDPATAGAKGIVTLGLSWFIFWAVYGIIAGINPYASLLAILDDSFNRIIEIYRNSSDLPADVLYSLEQVITGIREFLPNVLPGLLAGLVIITVWLNQVIGNTLLLRLRPAEAAWPRYSRWQLPDKLVWLLIAAAALSLLGSGVVKNAGYCLVIIAVILYFFQGLAVFVHFLDRWNVPRYLRIILYVILAVQSYGLLLLTMLGIADIWLNFRKMASDEQVNN
ncbi:MAG: DUF2232 domain-containing protein [Deltaproteobacteria bacterium]|nr:DUF2232 domain-containing protein [Deltaproteobacteria bacterium]